MVKCSDVGINNCTHIELGYDLDEVEKKKNVYDFRFMFLY